MQIVKKTSLRVNFSVILVLRQKMILIFTHSYQQQQRQERASRYATLEPLGYGNQNYQGHQ